MGVKAIGVHGAISIHAPAQGATQELRDLVGGVGFQSTPPRKGRQIKAEYEAELVEISIHAPAQGATAERLAVNPYWPISIHAPAQGATGVMLSTSGAVRFQSTPPRKGRQIDCKDDFRKQSFQSTPPRKGRRWIIGRS